MREQLIRYWKNTWVNGVIYRFEQAMQEMGFEKKDRRKKHQNKVYTAYNDYGNRATGGAYANDNVEYGNEIFQVVCRKSAGDYLIIGYNGERVFECDFRGVIHYNEEKLLKCVEEYKPFFRGIIGEKND